MAKLTAEELLFRKIEEKVKRAIFEYSLIANGDRILIGLSGGKDSLALSTCWGVVQKSTIPALKWSWRMW